MNWAGVWVWGYSVYLLDANVFLQAKNIYYGMDICPGFWRWLEESHRQGCVFSLDRVKDELLVRSDAVSAWARGVDRSFFLPMSPAAPSLLSAIQTWASTMQYRPGAVAAFLGKADPFLVAEASIRGMTLVTHEIPAPASKRDVKIPDACDLLDVPWEPPHRMLRREGVRFVLAPSQLALPL